MITTDRVVQAEEGTLSSGSITSKKRDQQWTLTQVGNWDYDKVDLNGDGDFVDTDEVNDHRTHNSVNELTGRDTDNNASDNYTLAYDAVGNLTDDGKDYEYEYDPFGRLRKVKKTTDQSLVAEYRYNGLGYKIAVHADTDTDGDVDSNDKWYYDAFDERWRAVARFRESDTSPKEEFVYHTAGNDGMGGSSYIDSVICRYKDANTSWTSASDGVLEERLYYCQNGRADVSAIVTSSGTMKEWVKYSAYGVPFGLPGGDTDSDGDCDSTDTSQVQTWIDVPAYDVRGDIDLDGDVDATDKSTIQSGFVGIVSGRNTLSNSSVLSRLGLSGHSSLASMSSGLDARARIMNTTLGRWITRDPAGYADGLLEYGYCRNSPVRFVDPTGQGGQGWNPWEGGSMNPNPSAPGVGPSSKQQGAPDPAVCADDFIGPLTEAQDCMCDVLANDFYWFCELLQAFCESQPTVPGLPAPDCDALWNECVHDKQQADIDACFGD